MDTMQEATATNPIAMRQLLEAGVHFGHHTGRWNPKMKPYIFGARNGIHIIDLQHTVKLFEAAFHAVVDVDRRAASWCCSSAPRSRPRTSSPRRPIRAGQFYVTERWLGGTLTNFKTVKGSLERLKTPREDGGGRHHARADQEGADRGSAASASKLKKSLGGIKDMNKLPGALFVIDPDKEHIAVDEARKLEIPVVGVDRHQLRPRRDRLRHPGQRRRHPRDQAVHRAASPTRA